MFIFADFVQPGRVLTVTAELLKAEGREVQLKTQGTVEGGIAVRGRLVLERYNLADARVDQAATDEYLKRTLRAHLALLYQPRIEVDTTDPSVLIAGQDSAPAVDSRQGLGDRRVVQR